MADEMDFESDLVLVNWASQEQESSVHPADAGDFDLAESALEESTLAREPSLENETEGEAEEMTNPLTLQNSAKEEDEQEPLEDDGILICIQTAAL